MQDIVQWDYGSWPDGLPKKGGANALSGAGSLDTATTCLSKTSRTKNFIIELYDVAKGMGKPFLFSLNESKNASHWPAYYPFCLSIRELHYRTDF
jgi:hypothetical protein